MQSKIPPAIREQLAEDPFMKECVIGVYGGICEGRIEWQHAMTYGGKRLNELYTILPLCSKHHREQAKDRQIQENTIIYRIQHFHAEAAFKEKYPKSNLLP